jgi:outer membrane lipoprotein-sorting protein
LKSKILKKFALSLATSAISCLICICASAAYAQNGGAWTTDSVVAHLDAAAKDFHSLSADIERTKVTVVVNDRSTETGNILVRGEKMVLDMKAPDARTVLRTGDTLYLYTPGLKRVEEYDIAKNRELVDQLLLLGFGTSGKELQSAYLISVGAETNIDNVKTIELDLDPKTDAVRKQISKIQIWLDVVTWLPVQQQFVEAGSGDYSIVKYSKIVRNPSIPDSAFKPNWPKGTVKVKPQF